MNRRALLAAVCVFAGPVGLVACADEGVVQPGAVTAGASGSASARASRESFEISETELRLVGQDKRIKITPELRSILDDVVQGADETERTLKRFRATPRYKQLAARKAPIDAAAQRESAQRRIRESQRAGQPSAMRLASVMDYTCTDLELAIYEQDELYKAAQQDFWESAATAVGGSILDGDWPGYSDLGELAVKARDVAMWRTSLNLLAATYSGAGCWG